MPINAIQRSGQRKEDALDKIAKGLAIAKGIMDVGTGVHDAVTTSDAEKMQKGQLTAMERASKNIHSAADLAFKKQIPAKEGEKGAYLVNLEGVDGAVAPAYYKPSTDFEELTKKLGAELALLNIKGKKNELAMNEGGKPLSESTIEKGGDFGSAVNSLNALKRTLSPNADGGNREDYGGLSAGVRQGIAAIPGLGSIVAPDTKKLVAIRDAAKQNIGKFLEGGILRKEDEAKYDKILPSIGDSPEIVAGKLENIQGMLDAKQSTVNALLSQSGFKTMQSPIQHAQIPSIPKKENPLAPATANATEESLTPDQKYELYLKRIKNAPAK